MTFKSLWDSGRRDIDIDDYIDTWHDSDVEGHLHEFLGMSFAEYAKWVETGIIEPGTHHLMER